MTKILILDDEPSIRNILRVNLRGAGYDVAEAKRSEEGLALAASYHPQVVILDLGLPDRNGIDVLREIRGWSQVPVIVLTVSDDEATKVALLEAGADDYVTKPFSVPELLARIKVALRHHQMEGATPIFESGSLRIDLAKREVSVENQVVHLTAKEFELLRLLVKNGGRVVPQEQLLAEIWGQHAKDQPHYLRIYIGQLRKKLEADPSSPKHVLTEPGVGYRIA